jgi:Methyltransferase domain
LPVLPAVLTDAVASGKSVRPDGTSARLTQNVTIEDAERLYDVVRTLQPEATVEIGLAHGISALAITQALDDNGRGMHHVIDPFQSSKWEGIGLANLARAHLDRRVRYYEAFPEEVLPTMPGISFGFIDSSHLFDLTLVDFVLVDKRLEIGGLIGFHDPWMPSQQKVLRYILANRNYRVHEDVPSRTMPDRPRRAWPSRLARRVPQTPIGSFVLRSCG